MKIRASFVFAVYLALVPANNLLAATKHKSSPKPIDVAEFLRALDADLTELDHQLTNLYSALPDSTDVALPTAAGTGWRQPASSVQAAALKIRATARHYRLASAASPSRASQKIFKSLEAASLTLAHAAKELRQAKTSRRARALRQRLTAQAVVVVRHGQTLTDGFAALTCTAQQSYCCVARVVKDGAKRVEGCRWTCTDKPAACRSGLFGPSALATEPSDHERLP